MSDYDLIRSKSFLGMMRPFLGYVARLNKNNKLLRGWMEYCSPQLEQKLLKAGFPGNLTGEEFCALKEIAPACFVFIMFFILQLPVSIIYVFAIFMGFILPDMWLNDRIRSRRIDIEKILPDALDTFALIVGAGLNFNEAIEIYIKEAKPNFLRDEFVVVNDETRLGRSVIESLKNMAKRIDSASIDHFITILLQSQKTGVPLSEVLDAQATDVRSRHFYLAEEAGNKAPIKMIFPLLLLIMPNVFIVLFAPMILKYYYKI
jgi:tight adherence protein C